MSGKGTSVHDAHRPTPKRTYYNIIVPRAVINILSYYVRACVVYAAAHVRKRSHIERS